MTKPHTGRCFCGQVRYSIDAEPLASGICWCRDCQYIASGSATVNVIFPQESVEIDGEVTTIEKIADSGNRLERGFCSKCGSQLFGRGIDPSSKTIRIRAGSLDNPDLMAPQIIIWTDSAPSWAVFDPKLPRHNRGLDSPLVGKAI